MKIEYETFLKNANEIPSINLKNYKYNMNYFCLYKFFYNTLPLREPEPISTEEGFYLNNSFQGRGSYLF
jgi:hypothetical protein